METAQLEISMMSFLGNVELMETATRSGVFANYNEAIPTDLDPEDLKMGDFTPWRIKIGGVSDTSLVSQVTITTSVDSTNKITFSVVNGHLLSEQKFILIPDGDLEAPPPVGYVPIRSDVETPGTRSMAADVVEVEASFTGGTSEKKQQTRVKDALVWRSLGWNPFDLFYDVEHISVPLETMKYNVEKNSNATKQWVLDRIKKKEIWYSLCHAKPALETTTEIKFDGLQFRGGDVLRLSDIAGLGLDYKLVMVDACCSAMTERLGVLDINFAVNVTTAVNLVFDPVRAEKLKNARSTDALVNECKTFANAFGPNAVYMGWAWTMNPTVAQDWTSEFLNNLKGGATVQQAYTKFRSDNGADYLASEKNQRLMKIYAPPGSTALDNVIDKTPKKDNVP